jgi:RimJ/RimL family protein N-acetyltransferase
VPLSAEVLHALLRGDLKTATVVAGVPLTPYFVEHQWLWDIRVAQLERDPASQNWIARAAVHRDAVVGHVGFHGPPDERGMVEVAYSVDPQYRRRGYGRRMLAAALLWAGQDPSVKIVRATIGPANVASIATLGAFPFEPVGEQWDDEDGLELVYELPLAPDHVQGPGDY